MRITIYKGYQNYLSHSFHYSELDKIKEQCYNLGIKYYTISYSEKEKLKYEELKEYEQFLKRRNKRDG